MSLTRPARAARVGRNIKLARELAGVSQNRLALKLGIDRRHLSVWERGIHEPDPGNLERLRAELDQPLEFFFADHDTSTAA